LQNTAPPGRARMVAGPFDYHVSIHDSDRIKDDFVYP